MNQLIIIGNTRFSSLLYRILEEEGYRVVAFCVSKKYCSSSTFEGLPLLPFEEIESSLNIEECSFLISIGYSKMNKVREFFYLECEKRKYNIFTFISKKATVCLSTIGKGSIILPTAYVGPNSNVGVCSIIWNGCNVSHDDTIGSFSYLSPCSAIAGGVRIGSYTFFGINCTIKNDVTIGDNCLVGASSYVNSNTEDDSVYVGVPARKIEKENPIETIENV